MDPWIQDFSQTGTDDSADYFAQLSEFLKQNPAPGTIDIKAFDSMNNPQLSQMNGFPNYFNNTTSEGSSPECTSSNASHTYDNTHAVEIPTSASSDHLQLAARRQQSQDSSTTDESGHGATNKNGKRAGEATSKKGAQKDRKANVVKDKEDVHHTHEEEDSADKKSGKKKATTSDKRKEQNRMAQRAFRDRKEQHAKKLEDQVAALEQAAADREAENQNLKELVARLQNENARLAQFEDTKFTFSAPLSASSSALPITSAAVPVSGIFPSIQQRSPSSSSAASDPLFAPSTSFTSSPAAFYNPVTTPATIDELLATSESVFTPSGEHFNFSSFGNFPATTSAPEQALSPNTAALFSDYREPSSMLTTCGTKAITWMICLDSTAPRQLLPHFLCLQRLGHLFRVLHLPSKQSLCRNLQKIVHYCLC